jgi:hypothetical protein
MAKNPFVGGIIRLCCRFHFLGEIDLKSNFLTLEKDGGNKICFDQLNSIFAKN